MKKINSLLRKCKSLSRQLGRSSSYSSLRSKSTREDLWVCEKQEEDFEQQIEQKVSGSNVILYVGIVLFDHLLWMLENSDPNITFDSNLEELAELYVF
uniref:Uncharacterized protein n=1 Tax=Cucumis sativus TaxID=3659 RepID=A0A0A0L464_CUCSA